MDGRKKKKTRNASNWINDIVWIRIWCVCVFSSFSFRRLCGLCAARTQRVCVCQIIWLSYLPLLLPSSILQINLSIKIWNVRRSNTYCYKCLNLCVCRNDFNRIFHVQRLAKNKCHFCFSPADSLPIFFSLLLRSHDHLCKFMEHRFKSIRFFFALALSLIHLFHSFLQIRFTFAFKIIHILYFILQMNEKKLSSLLILFFCSHENEQRKREEECECGCS